MIRTKMIRETDFYKNRKKAQECAEYIVKNDISARKQAEVIKRYCPAEVDLERFSETVSNLTYMLLFDNE